MKRSAFGAFVGIIVAGCATTNPISTPPYYPSNPSAVLLTHEGEIQTSGIVSNGGETFLAAYALTPHIGLLADGSLALHKAGDPNGNQYSGDLGIGYFDTSASGHIVHELYGAVGLGTVHDYLPGYTPSFTSEQIPSIKNDENVRFGDAWLQAAGGYVGRNFSIVAVGRFSYLNLYWDRNQESISYQFQGLAMPFDTSFTRTSHFFIVSPGFEIRFGLEYIQLIASLFERIPFGAINYIPATILESLGICYKF